MLFTVGVMLTALGGLLCSLGTLTLWRSLRAGRAKPPSRPASASTSSDPAPPKWEVRLLELDQAVSSLSSTVEKVLREQRKREQRDAMRELRTSPSGPPPPGASKAELRAYYGLNGHTPQEIAARHQPGATDGSS